MPTTLQKKPEQKRVSISSKRQFIIPQKFYSELGFGTEAICTMGEGILIIQPVFEIITSKIGSGICSCKAYASLTLEVIT